MAATITGYRIFTSKGGNKCLHCKTKMVKGLPYLSPVSGKEVIHERKGKAICMACLELLYTKFQEKLEDCPDKDIDKFNTKRFVKHLG